MFHIRSYETAVFLAGHTVQILQLNKHFLLLFVGTVLMQIKDSFNLKLHWSVI